MRLVWPFFALEDERGRSTGYAALNGPVRTPLERAAFEVLVDRVRFVGFTSFLTFPHWPGAADGLDYHTLCTAWCHCFREPDNYLPAGVQRIRLTHADFTDPSLVSPGRLCPDDGDRDFDFDFVYVCQKGAAQERVRNWDLALRCLPVLCGGLGLRGLLVGRAVIPELDSLGLGDHVAVVGPMPWADLMRCFRRARLLFVPNGLDASPRIVAEALAMDTPVLVNRHILGGWHFVNPFTGSFFESEADVTQGARRCLERWTSPREWFRSNHGPVLAGRRLARFMSTVDPALHGVKRVDLKLDLNLTGRTMMPSGR